MTSSSNRSGRIIVIAVIATALATAALTAGGFYLAGFHRAPALTDFSQGDNTSDGETQLWTCGMHPWIITEEPGLCPICNMDLIPKRDGGKTPSNPGERQVAYWRAPMDPMEIYNEPGKSKMGMDLVPVYEDEIIGGVEVSIDPVTRQNMGLRTEVAATGPLVSTIRTYGHVTVDETLTAEVSPKIDGWIETLYADFTGKAVETGEPLIEIYSPQLLSAQEEYLSLYRSLKTGKSRRDQDLLASARQRLSWFDVAETEIQALEASGAVSKTLVIRSPFTGIITSKQAVEGAFVKAGTRLFNIADLSRVWVEAHIYEYELDQVKVGQKAVMDLPYLPGRSFSGTVSFIYPFLQAKTRDVVVLLEFDNPAGLLKPDMYADVTIKTGEGEAGLRIASEAVVRSGERNVVFVDKGDGRFQPREVVLGRILDQSRVQVLEGLAPGERIVTSGQFMLDSESKLQEAVKKMMERNEPDPAAQPSGGDEGDSFFDDMETPEPDDFFKDMES